MTPAGFLLAQESHCGPLTRRCLRHRRPLPRWGEAYWTAACAGMTLWPPHPAVPSAPPASPAVGRGVLGSCLRGKETKGHTQRSLGPCFRRDDTCWISACAGITLWPPHPAVPWAPPASPAVGRGVLDSCLRRDDTGVPSAGFGFASAGLCPPGERRGDYLRRALCTRSGRWKRSKSASASGRSWPVCGSNSRKHSNSMALVLSWPS